MEKMNINIKQFIWILFVLFTSFSVLQMPGLLVRIAGRDAWLSAIGGWVIDIVFGALYAYMGIRFPNENFVQYSITILGKYLGRIVALIFPISFLLISVLIQISLSTVIANGFLTETPVIVVFVCSYLIVGYAVKNGIEVISRVCEIIGPIFLISLVVLFLLLAPITNIDHLKPQFDKGIYPFLSGSLFMVSYLGICIMMGMYIPICNRPENGLVAKFAGSSMGSLIICLVVSFSVAIFGFQQVQKALYPALSIASMVNYAGFLERLEIIWLIISVGAAIVTTANLLWAFNMGISQIAGLSSYKPLVFPSILLSLVLATTSFDNNAEFSDFLRYSFPVFAGIMTLIVILLFITALVLKKKGSQQEN